MSLAYSKQTILDALVAHRGASEHAPENTMAAFRLAHEQGAKWLEFDVTTMGDSSPIIMHDATTDRCGDQSVHLTDLNQSNLKTIDVGAGFSSEFKGETIPHFSEILEWLQTNEISANVEIKRHTHQQDTQAFVQPILDVLAEYQSLWPRLLITSFDSQSLDYCMTHAPALARGALFNELPENWLALTEHWGAKTIHMNYQFITESMLFETKKRNIITRCFTPKAYTDVENHLHQGLTSVIVNSPPYFKRVISEQFLEQ